MKRPGRTDVLLACSVVFFASMIAVRFTRGAEAGQEQEERILATGDSLPGFWKDLALEEQPRGPTLAVLYTTECPWCRLSVKRWNRLREQVLRLDGARAVAVSLSDSASTSTYASETGLEFAGTRVSDAEVEKRWRVVAVPYTVLLDPSGRVRGAWRGVVDSTRYEAVRAAIGPAQASAPAKPGP
ncbi:MAG TPA: hypothetical protein VF746_04310 [Longimicrobium sp.]|jgi:peroxiredoxin